MSFFVPTISEHFILNYNVNSIVQLELGVNKVISLLVDSGASICVVKYEWLLDHPEYLKELYYDKLTIKGISGKLISEGYVYLDLLCQGIIFREKFYVFKDLSCTADGILGENFFRHYNAVINYEAKTLRLCNKGSVISLNIGRSNDRYTHVIPARCEIIKHIPCTLKGDSVVLAEEIKEGVFVAGMISKPSQSGIPLRILNTTNENIEIDFSSVNIQPINNFEVAYLGKNSKSVERVKTLFELLDLNYLNKEERLSIEQICAKYADVFHLPGDSLSVTNLMEHNIVLKDNVTPVYVKPYRIPQALKSEIEKQVQEMLDNDIIEETISEWSSPVLLVPKKADKSNQKKWRLVIDYRQLNNSIQDDKFPLPNITEILDSLSGSIYFSKLDLSQSYYQLSLNPNSRKYTSFGLNKMYQLSLDNESRKYTTFTAGKQYQMKRCPMGLKTSASVFSRLMTIAMAGLNYQKCFIYLDDCVVIGNCIENHNKNLIDVLNRLREVNLKLNPIKCEFMRKEIIYLGHKITQDGIFPDPGKIDTIRNYPRPSCADDVKRFVAFANYYRRFISGFADIVFPLNRLCKKGILFEWTNDCETSFNKLKSALMNPPVLDYPDFSDNNIFKLQTDASKLGLGAVLSNGNGKVIAYASRSLKPAETRYPVIELELLAIVWAVRHFRPYLYGRKFVIYSDHRPLVYLFSLKDPSSRLTKFRLYLEEYDFIVEYVPGRNNAAADALSRLSVTSQDLKDMCEHSVSVLTRAQRKKLKAQIGGQTDKLPSVCGPDQPAAVEVLKRPNKVVELRFFLDNQKALNDANIIISNAKYCTYVPSQSTIFLHSRSLSSPEELARDLEKMCKQLNISELLITKNKSNSKNISYLLRSVNQSKIKSPRFLIIKDLKRISNKEEIITILNDFHLLPTSGHAGINRMINNIKKYYFWPGMSNDVMNYVKKCRSCQIQKSTNKHVREPLTITSTAKSAFERVSLDIMGPLDIDNYDNKYILTVQCDLSKFVEAYPLPRKDSETVARCFVNNFILRYGIPKQFISDRGTEFTSSIISEVCNLLNIEKIHSTSYHHETLGGLENTHKHLGAYLRIQCENNQSDWSDWIPFWCFSFNTSVHSQTKYTPYELVFGKVCNLPSNLAEQIDPLYNFDDYPRELKYRLQRAQQDARQNLLECKSRRKISYDQKLNCVTYKPGDLILVKNQIGNKLNCIYKGPYKVIEELSPNVKINKNNKEILVHKNNTKPFYE